MDLSVPPSKLYGRWFSLFLDAKTPLFEFPPCGEDDALFLDDFLEVGAGLLKTGNVGMDSMFAF